MIDRANKAGTECLFKLAIPAPILSRWSASIDCRVERVRRHMSRLPNAAQMRQTRAQSTPKRDSSKATGMPAPAPYQASYSVRFSCINR